MDSPAFGGPDLGFVDQALSDGIASGAMATSTWGGAADIGGSAGNPGIGADTTTPFSRLRL
jgi:hypothetical protein